MTNGKTYRAPGHTMHLGSNGQSLGLGGILRRSTLSFDKDGVLTNNGQALCVSDALAARELSGTSLHDAFMAITAQTRDWLETLNGYTSTSMPAQAIIAVTKHLAAGRSHSNPCIQGAFDSIRTRNDPVSVLRQLIKERMGEDDHNLAERIFRMRTETTYRSKEAAAHIVEIPGASKAFLDVVESKGKEDVCIFTSTETVALAHLHLTASFESAGLDYGSLAGVRILTAEDVSRIKPDPEGILLLKKPEKPLIHIGDGHSDAKAVAAARELGLKDVHFIAVAENGRVPEFLEYSPLAIIDHIGVIAEALRD